MLEPAVLRIDLSSPQPAYRQIAAGVRALLVAGRFRPGDVLPTIRQLAVDLTVHPNTVAQAYRVLADEGWIDLRRRLGATVLARPLPRPGPEAAGAFVRRLGELVAEAVASGVGSGELASSLRSLADELERKGSPS